MRMRHSGFLLAGAVALTAACDQNTSPSDRAVNPGPSLAATSTGANPALVALNNRLASRGLNVRVLHADYVTSAASGQAGQTIFAFDRGNKRLGTDYVPNDERRHPGTNITYLVDQSDGATSTPPVLTSAETEAAIDRAMTTWETTTRCSNFAIDKVADPGVDPDIADGLILGDPALIGTPFFADIVHAGWTPAAFFDVLAPGGSQFILAVTFSFIFIDDAGNPTDINHDGQFDTALSETYYNDAFAWGIDVSTFPFDVETVALHESGHALSQDHFGKIFRTDANGLLHFAPFAVMNAAISRQAHELTGTDLAGHCSLWGSWPHR
jgi:hypothetical protein